MTSASTSHLLDAVHIVLSRTSHPGNIGATARAMKNMSLQHLHLITPEVFPSDHATARAAGADDILQQARVCTDLTEAAGECHWVVGTSARKRSLPQPLLTPKQLADEARQRLQQGQHVAIVFGHERNGLSNDELIQCHAHVQIPCNPAFSSLNLAAAVQVIGYELHCACDEPEKLTHVEPYDALASYEQIQGFFTHFENTLQHIDFLDRDFPKRIMPKLRRLFQRTDLEVTELHILRGILSAIDRHVGQHE